MKRYLLILWSLLFLTSSLAAEPDFADAEYLLAVITNEFSHDFELTIIDIEGRKSYDFPESIRGNHPAWSPCGKWIALERDGNIVLVSSDGSTFRRVTDDKHGDMMPGWSPDGQQITFFSRRDGNLEVMIVNADGSGVLNLTNHPAVDADPAWCPRGEEIVFLSNRSGDLRLYVVGSDGTGLRLFSERPTLWVYPAWHPNGRFLAFPVRDQSGAYQLLISDRSGRKTRQITHGSGVHSWAAWSPDGRYLAYCRLGMEPPGNKVNGDLIIYDILRDTHRPVLVAALPNGGSRVSWKPFVPHGGQQVVQQVSEAVEMEARDDPVHFSDAPPPLAVAPFDSVQARQHQENWAKYLGLPVEWTNWLGMKFVLIPPGEFMMGATESEVMELVEDWTQRKRSQWLIDNVLSEAPQHFVRITKPFYLGVHEVTQYQYQQVIGTNPSHFQSHPECDCTSESQRKTSGSNPTATDLNRPVELVTWEEAVVFCRTLSALEPGRTGRVRYALPTEAQWEYACRAGTTTRYYFGDAPDLLDEHAWWAGNAGNTTHPTGQKMPNAWGLYDMIGNVWNWCSDFWAIDYYANSPVDDPTGPEQGERVVQRGGAWSRGDGLHLFRSTQRAKDYPNSRHHATGFRVVKSIHD